MATVGNQDRIIACLHEAPVVITAIRVASWIVDSSARSAAALFRSSINSPLPSCGRHPRPVRPEAGQAATLPIGPSNTRAATFRRYDMRNRDPLLATS